MGCRISLADTAQMNPRHKPNEGDKPIEFIPPEQVFEPETKVTMTDDVNGWVNKRGNKKWQS